MTAEHVFGVTVAGDSSCDKCCCQSCHSLSAARVGGSCTFLAALSFFLVEI